MVWFIHSGIIPVVPETGEIPGGALWLRRNRHLPIFHNLLEAAGTSMDNVVKTTVFIKEMNDFGAINEVYATFFDGSISHPEAVWKLHVFQRMSCLRSKRSQSNRKSSSRELHVSDTLELFFMEIKIHKIFMLYLVNL